MRTDCDGGSRRDFLKIGALGTTGLMLPDLLRARAAASANGTRTRNTSVVWLWLGGGPTHVETFDPKMSAPAEFRSTVGAVQTNVQSPVRRSPARSTPVLVSSAVVDPLHSRNRPSCLP